MIVLIIVDQIQKNYIGYQRALLSCINEHEDKIYNQGVHTYVSDDTHRIQGDTLRIHIYISGLFLKFLKNLKL